MGDIILELFICGWIRFEFVKFGCVFCDFEFLFDFLYCNFNYGLFIFWFLFFFLVRL